MKTTGYNQIALLVFYILSFQLLSAKLFSQERQVNYEESKIEPYTLPDPLKLENGVKVTSAQMWWEQRRPEIMALFEDQMYGKTPDKKLPIIFKVTSAEAKAFEGKAIRKEVTIYFTDNTNVPSMVLLIYLPTNAQKPSPVFLSMNFGGNHTIATDTASWPIERIIERGYGLATFCYQDITTDNSDCFQNGVFPLFYMPGQTKPAANEWGALGAWAWGLSRAMDYIVADKDMDSKKVVVMGHSRLGKATLWAGAQDQRFAIVISNNSGCGGAALSKRDFGETVRTANKSFPYWFCDNFRKYSDNEAALPVDQHQLIALVAPRPVYIASAEDDHWSDPHGEFLGALNASLVYKLLGTDGLSATQMPSVNQPIMSTIGYHVRTGKHAVMPFDWARFLDFADMHFNKTLNVK